MVPVPHLSCQGEYAEAATARPAAARRRSAREQIGVVGEQPVDAVVDEEAAHVGARRLAPGVARPGRAGGRCRARRRGPPHARRPRSPAAPRSTAAPGRSRSRRSSPRAGRPRSASAPRPSPRPAASAAPPAAASPAGGRSSPRTTAGRPRAGPSPARRVRPCFASTSATACSTSTPRALRRAGDFSSGKMPARPFTSAIASSNVGIRAPANRASNHDPASSVFSSASVKSFAYHRFAGWPSGPLSTTARSGKRASTSVVRSSVSSCRHTSTPSLVSVRSCST